MFSFEAWWQILTTKLPVFFQGVGTTVELALCTAIFGTLLGIVVALLRMSRVKLLKVLAGAYIEFLRGTPLLVQVLIVFYGLPQMGVKLPRMTAGTVASTARRTWPRSSVPAYRPSTGDRPRPAVRWA